MLDVCYSLQYDFEYRRLAEQQRAAVSPVAESPTETAQKSCTTPTAEQPNGRSRHSTFWRTYASKLKEDI